MNTGKLHLIRILFSKAEMDRIKDVADILGIEYVNDVVFNVDTVVFPSLEVGPDTDAFIQLTGIDFDYIH